MAWRWWIEGQYIYTYTYSYSYSYRERERERAAAATATALVWGGLREENVGGVSTRARNGVDDTILVLMFSVGECGQGVLFVRVSARRQTTRERREEP